MGKISGPMLDRIAIHVAVRPVDIEAWKASPSAAMGSAAMREMVTRARAIQARRFAGVDGIDCNARIPEGMFGAHCAMEPAAEAVFTSAQRNLHVSARSRGHIVRVARTIADLEGCARIGAGHISEAVGYRGRG
jgi:magnesium chelatase family protein